MHEQFTELQLERVEGRLWLAIELSEKKEPPIYPDTDLNIGSSMQVPPQL